MMMLPSSRRCRQNIFSPCPDVALALPDTSASPIASMIIPSNAPWRALARWPGHSAWVREPRRGIVMQIVILGAGALGSLLAAHLVRSGEDVALIARGTRAQSLQQHGVTICGLANFVTPVRVIARPQALQQADALLVTVKTYDMESALDSVAHLQVSSVLSVQNGLVKNEQLARRFGWENTLGAAAHVSAEVLPTGVVRFTANEWLSIGEFPEGTSARVEALVAALARAGIHAEASGQIASVEWTKYVVNISWMALSALSRMETY